MAKRNNPEYNLHRAICRYISLQYPKTIYNSDHSGVNMSKTARGQAKTLRSERGIPDLVIYEPKGEYHGLFLEIKTSSPFKKDGEIKNNEHLKEQQHVLWKLEQRGYRALFVWSLTEAMIIIDEYMKG